MRKSRSIAAVVILLASIGCNNEINRSSAPVELVMHNLSQPIHTFDFQATSTANCQQNVVNVQIENRIKNPATTNTAFLDVRLTPYRVVWTRTDGGKPVPAPVDQTMNTLVSAGGTSSDFVF